MYGCIVRDATGGEDIYTITLPSDLKVTFTLSGMSVDLDLYFLEYCQQWACLSWGDTTITYTLIAGKTYYLVVDGYMGAEGAYTISMTCAPAPPQLDCAGAPDACERIITDNNISAPNNVDNYPSCIVWDEGGGEKVYRVNLTTGYIQAQLSGMSCDLDLFLLSACDEKKCVKYGDNRIDTGLYPVAPGLYYLVVDGFLGDRCNYTLTVICGTPTPTPSGVWYTPTPSSTPTKTFTTTAATNTPSPTFTKTDIIPTNTPTPTPSSVVPFLNDLRSVPLLLFIFASLFLIVIFQKLAHRY